MINRIAEQAGDTIIEVLVAMSVLMMILVGAYVTANRSLNSERDAQEHTEALTIAQGQVEDLHAGYQLVDSEGNADQCFNPNNPTLSTGGQNCFENGSGQFCQTATAGTSANCTPSTDLWYQITDSEISDPIILSTVTPALTSPTYEVSVSWPSISGSSDNVQLYYRPE